MRSKNKDLMKNILAYVNCKYFEEGITPSFEEIGAHLGVNKATVSRYVAEMKANGILFSGEGWRSLRTREMEKASTTLRRVPVVGEVACGTPILAEQNVNGYLCFSSDFLGQGEFFALRAKGDSMIGAGICNGDTVLVRRQNTAENGDIVVALIEDEATLKRFYLNRAKGKVILHPENESMQDMYFDSVAIQGVVKKIIKDCDHG